MTGGEIEARSAAGLMFGSRPVQPAQSPVPPTLGSGARYNRPPARIPLIPFIAALAIPQPEP